jgi:hypothetical protein
MKSKTVNEINIEKVKIDYFKIVRTSKQSGKIFTINDVHKQVLEARAEKLKKAN